MSHIVIQKEDGRCVGGGVSGTYSNQIVTCCLPKVTHNKMSRTEARQRAQDLSRPRLGCVYFTENTRLLD